MKTALVTGSRGFVGRYIKKELESRDWMVYGLDLLGWYPVDVVNYFRDRLPFTNFDLVVHAAAVAPHRVGIDTDHLSFAKNLVLDSEMFQWAVRTKQKAVLYLSSSAAYQAFTQTSDWCAQEEVYAEFYSKDIRDLMLLHEDDINLDDIESPFDNYGWTKLTGEKVAKAAAAEGLRVHVVRPFSGYAEDQSLDFPFPAIVKRASEGDLSVWGPSGQTRDWIHIDDVVKGALAVVEDDDRRPVNLCTGIGTEMGELMLGVRKQLWERGELKSWFGPVDYQSDKPTGAFYRVGDPTRMNEHYIAKVSLEEGISRALDREKTRG